MKEKNKNPIKFNRILLFNEVSYYRYYNCQYYYDCLSYVADHTNWPSFSCRQCQFFIKYLKSLPKEARKLKLETDEDFENSEAMQQKNPDHFQRSQHNSTTQKPIFDLVNNSNDVFYNIILANELLKLINNLDK